MTNKKLVLVKSEYLKSIFGNIDFIEQGNGNNIIGTLIHESDKGKCSVEFGIAGKLNNIILSGIPFYEVTIPKRGPKISIQIDSFMSLFPSIDNCNIFRILNSDFEVVYDNNGCITDKQILDEYESHMNSVETMLGKNRNQFILIDFMHTDLDMDTDPKYFYEIVISIKKYIIYKIPADRVEKCNEAGCGLYEYNVFKDTADDGLIMFRLRATPVSDLNIEINKIYREK